MKTDRLLYLQWTVSEYKGGILNYLGPYPVFSFYSAKDGVYMGFEGIAENGTQLIGVKDATPFAIYFGDPGHPVM